MLVAKKLSLLLNVAWLLKFSLCELDWKWSKHSFVLSFAKSILAKSTSFWWNNIKFFKINSCKINIFAVEISMIQCILIDFLLIISNVNFLSSSWFWMTLYSCDFAVVDEIFCSNQHSICSCECIDVLVKMYCFEFLSWSRFDLILKTFLIFWRLIFEIANESTEIVAFALFFVIWKIENSFWMSISTSCADFFNRLDVFDLSILLWIIEIWNDWRLSLKMSMKSNDWNCLL